MAKTSNKRKTKNQQAYEKELARIKRFMRSAEKRGYQFIEEPNLVIPARITKKKLEEIKGVTPDVLYSYTRYYDPILDLYVSGAEERKLIRQRAGKKAAKAKTGINVATEPPRFTDVVLSNAEDMLSKWAPYSDWDKYHVKVKTHDKSILQNLITGAIRELGRNQVAINIEKNADRFNELMFHILYGSSDDKWGDIQPDIVEIAAIIRGRGLTVAEAKSFQNSADAVNVYFDDEDEYE